MDCMIFMIFTASAIASPGILSHGAGWIYYDRQIISYKILPLTLEVVSFPESCIILYYTLYYILHHILCYILYYISYFILYVILCLNKIQEFLKSNLSISPPWNSSKLEMSKNSWKPEKVFRYLWEFLRILHNFFRSIEEFSMKSWISLWQRGRQLASTRYSQDDFTYIYLEVTLAVDRLQS